MGRDRGERAGGLTPRPAVHRPAAAQHRPEQTLLYRLVEQHYPAFLVVREVAGRPPPAYVQQEFESYLKCGRLEHGFLLTIPAGKQRWTMTIGVDRGGT